MTFLIISVRNNVVHKKTALISTCTTVLLQVPNRKSYFDPFFWGMDTYLPMWEKKKKERGKSLPFEMNHLLMILGSQLTGSHCN